MLFISMMFIRCYLAMSKIAGAGIGCFTKQPVKKGDLVWEFDPRLDRLYSVKEVEKFMEQGRGEFIRSHGFMDIRSKMVMVCLDEGGYVNHSTNANITNTYEEGGILRCRALEDIPANTEITQDYAELPDWDGATDALVVSAADE